MSRTCTFCEADGPGVDTPAGPACDDCADDLRQVAAAEAREAIDAVTDELSRKLDGDGTGPEDAPATTAEEPRASNPRMDDYPTERVKAATRALNRVNGVEWAEVRTHTFGRPAYIQVTSRGGFVMIGNIAEVIEDHGLVLTFASMQGEKMHLGFYFSEVRE